MTEAWKELEGLLSTMSERIRSMAGEHDREIVLFPSERDLVLKAGSEGVVAVAVKMLVDGQLAASTARKICGVFVRAGLVGAG